MASQLCLHGLALLCTANAVKLPYTAGEKHYFVHEPRDLQDSLPPPPGDDFAASFPAHTAGQGTCRGTQHQESACPDQPSCQDQECIDCTFRPWGDWASCDCTGLQIRARQVDHFGTPCGRECNGTLQDSKRCTPSCHHDTPVDCSLSDWSEWTGCASDSPADSANRTKTVVTAASNGGEGCQGDMVQTRPCGQPEETIDCKLSEWAAWTDCSKTCDTGQMTRLRRVIRHAAFGGAACEDVLLEINECHTVRCGEDNVCEFSQWSDWHGCSASTQEERTRHLHSADHNCGGDKNTTGLVQTQPCPPPKGQEARNCELTIWQSWLPCSQTCGGGQQYRMREIASAPEFGGVCEVGLLRETQPCGVGPCHGLHAIDCTFSEWGQWSECSNECGDGVRDRSRTIKSKAEGEGKGCVGLLSEAGTCFVKPCLVQDCKWGEWSTYSECTCTCGGGSMWRQREIVNATKHGGAFCPPRTKTETTQCNVDPCIPTETCRDGAWAEWRPWSECSASCDEGFKKRSRYMDTMPSQCGQPATGSPIEYQTCDMGPCTQSQDCEFGEWAAWSDCSCPCYGMHSKSRNISAFKSGGGKSCDGPLTVKEQCNPTVNEEKMFWNTPPEGCDKLDPPQNCTMSDWQEWSDCSVSCGDGQTQRLRVIESPNMNGGAPCTSPNISAIATMETNVCNNRECVSDCVDCAFHEWSEWSVCTKAEQKSRHRHFNMSNYCGKPCELDALKEIVNCSLKRVTEYCVWNEWSVGDCSATCGPASKVATRKLHMTEEKPEDGIALFSNDDGKERECIGTQKKRIECPVVPCPDHCEPIDCSFGPWSDYSPPTCEGLCIKTRVVQTINNHCGELCDGPLIQTKSCPNITCDDVIDCQWGEWAEWSDCISRLENKIRKREIARMAVNEGLPCNGSSTDVAPCTLRPPPEPVPCSVSDWGNWGPCSDSCNGGFKKRTRYIEMASRYGGTPCSNTLVEIVGCAAAACPTVDAQDCALGQWADWTTCEGHSQRERNRQVVIPAQGGGQGCNGTLSMTMACKFEPFDCVMNNWTDWDQCDKTCEGGQTTRHRQVKTRPHNGGLPCEPDLVETKPCNEDPCVVGQDCVWGNWEAWKPCPVTCGLGQQDRSRLVTTEASDGGVGCAGEKEEVRPCGDGTDATPNIGPCGNPTDCVWGEWEDDEPCGGIRRSEMDSVGRHKRSRTVETSPRDGGMLCTALSKREVVACDLPVTSSVVCTDGAWGAWQPWAPCTATCGGGLKSRARMVTTMANSCGKPVSGSMQEYAACNTDPCQVAPCVFADWREWDDCTCTCNGIRERRRSIHTYAQPGGDPCLGPTKEAEPCNEATVTEGCSVGELNEDCVLGDWVPWQACSKTCGGGQKSRTRSVLTPNTGLGLGCSGPTSQLVGCSMTACPGVHPPVDCEWDDWTPWGDCRQGVQDRNRPLRTKQENGGQLCEETTAREMRPCETEGGSGTQTHWCTWADWEDWGNDDCPVCGEGRRERSRRLEYRASMPEMDRLYEESSTENEALRQTAAEAERSRIQELATSFAAGMACLMVPAFAAGRWSRRSGPEYGRVVHVALGIE